MFTFIKTRMSHSLQSVEHLGVETLQMFANTGHALFMLAEAFRFSRYALSKRNRNETVDQLFTAGIKSIGVVTVVSLFTGMILALQTGMELKRYEQEVFIGSAVAVSVIREMGPFMTGLILAASVGSGIAGQLGTMVVSEEVSALKMMGININRFLVMPRLVALMIMTPVVTVYANVLGILGGALVGYTQLRVEVQAYLHNAAEFSTVKDFYAGLLKAVVFGILVAVVACHQGFSARGGAVGVGLAIRRAVVISFLLILISGYMLTQALFI